MEMITKTNFSNNSKSISHPFNWEIPPNRVSIKPGDVHIWKVDLKVIAAYQDAAKILSTDERERAARIIDPLRRGRFRSARFVLRNILSLYNYLPPEEIELSYGRYGKPFIKQKALKCSISFNITHSTNLMLVALSNSCQIGIDLEKEHSITTKEWIIKQYFSQKDNYFFRHLPGEERLSAFLLLWTLKEAHAKALGSGFGAAPDLDFSERDHHCELRLNQMIIYPKEDFWFLCFSPDKGFIASAAVLTTVNPVPRFYSYKYESET